MLNQFVIDYLDNVKDQAYTGAQKTVEAAQTPIKCARLAGYYEGIEFAMRELRTALDKAYVPASATQMPLNFDSMVNALDHLPEDAPIEFVILAGLGAKKPMTKTKTTMGELRKQAAVMRAFKHAAGTL